MKKFALLACLLTACGPIQPITDSVIDCLGDNRPQIDALLKEFKPLITADKMSWPAVRTRAKQAGLDIGACVVMELTQWYLSGSRGADDAEQLYEDTVQFRTDFMKGAKVRTMCERENGVPEVCEL